MGRRRMRAQQLPPQPKQDRFSGPATRVLVKFPTNLAGARAAREYYLDRSVAQWRRWRKAASARDAAKRAGKAHRTAGALAALALRDFRLAKRNSDHARRHYERLLAATRAAASNRMAGAAIAAQRRRAAERKQAAAARRRRRSIDNLPG